MLEFRGPEGKKKHDLGSEKGQTLGIVARRKLRGSTAQSGPRKCTRRTLPEEGDAKPILKKKKLGSACPFQSTVKTNANTVVGAGSESVVGNLWIGVKTTGRK